MALTRQKKLRFVTGLVLAVLFIWYSAGPYLIGIFSWPIKQVTIPFETSPADHDSLVALELGAEPRVEKDTRSVSSENSFNENLPLHDKKLNVVKKTQEEKSEQNYTYPWELCQPMKFFSDYESRPLTALASFPGSGNTWVRYLLQQSTGIHTGHEDLKHPDKSLRWHGFPGEGVADTSVTVVKTHRPARDTRIEYDRAVLLIREPGAAILANYNRLYSNSNHTGNANQVSFLLYWKKFFYDTLPRWRMTNLDWLQNFKGPLHVLMYEDLVNNLEVTLRALITFLGLPVDEAALQCTLQRPEGAFHRKQRKYPFELFDSEMLAKIKTDEYVVYQEIKRRKN